MSNLETLLDDAIGDVQPSFSLADIEADGSAMRRRARRRTAVLRVAAALAFVVLVPLLAVQVRTDDTTSLATQESVSPRFVKPGTDSSAQLHMPTFFDRDALARSSWPDGVAELVGGRANVWTSNDGQALISVDLSTLETCRFDLELGGEASAGSCVTLHDLADDAVLTNWGADTALVTYQHEGPELSELVQAQAGRNEGGLVQFDLVSRLSWLRGLNEIAMDEGEVTAHVDGQLVDPPILTSCIRTDAGISVSLGLDASQHGLPGPVDTVRLLRLSGRQSTSRVWQTSVEVEHEIIIANFAAAQRREYAAAVFVAPGVADTQIDAIRMKLDREFPHDDVVFFDQAQAFGEFQEMFRDDRDILDTVQADSVPASFRIPLSVSLGEVERVVDEYSDLSGVMRVVPLAGLLMPNERGVTHLLAFANTADGPLAFGSYTSAGSTVELLVECGDAHLDARTTHAVASGRGPVSWNTPSLGDQVGQLDIPHIDVDIDIVRGVERELLQDAAGSYPSTSLPGTAGNSGIAAHRTTYGAPFLRLDELERGDAIVATTVHGRFLYLVDETTIVEVTEGAVLDDFGDNRLTLTTEHPAYGSTQRLVVTARLVGEPVATGPRFDADQTPASLE